MFRLGRTEVYTSDNYAARLHQQWPDCFEWIASIHPYRLDCVEALEQAVAKGARAVTSNGHGSSLSLV